MIRARSGTRGEIRPEPYQVIPNTLSRDSVAAYRNRADKHSLESLILAQDERWRRA